MRIPDSQRLGEVGAGWTVSLTTLMNERLAVGGAPPPDATDLLDHARKVHLENGPAIEDSAVRDRIADWYVEQQGLKHIRSRSLTALSRGETPGPEASIAKVVSANKLQEVSSFGTDLLDVAGQIIDPEQAVSDAIFQSGFYYAPGLRIAGGTDEILRNIIAERVLAPPGRHPRRPRPSLQGHSRAARAEIAPAARTLQSRLFFGRGGSFVFH